MFVLDEGMVKHVRVEADGTQTIVNIASLGSLVGIVGAELDGVHDVTAECIDTCALRVVPVRDLELLRQVNREIDRWIVRMLAWDRRVQKQHISLRRRRDPASRLSALLAICPAIRIVARPDGGATLVPQMPYRDLAGLAGLTPEHFSRVLARWERGGLIRRTARGLVVPHGSALIGVVRPP